MTQWRACPASADDGDLRLLALGLAAGLSGVWLDARVEPSSMALAWRLPGLHNLAVAIGVLPDLASITVHVTFLAVVLGI